MAKIPCASIIIPVYNREKIIDETLQTAIDQTYEDYEIIIVDNKSTDNTYEILEKYEKKYEKIKIYQNEKNLGPVRNWKKALELSRGKYIKILWSDDQISKDFLEKTIPILEKDANIGFVYTKTLVYGNNINREVYKFGNTGKYNMVDFIKGSLLGEKEIPVSPGCALFRKEDLLNNLLIDLENPKKLDFSRYGAGNDLLLFLKCYPKYQYFYFIDDIKSYFRAHKDSFSISNNLEEYYDFSKVYFLEQLFNNKELEDTKDKFYTKLYIKKRYMVKEVRFKFKWKFILKKILKKIINIHKNKRAT